MLIRIKNAIDKGQLSIIQGALRDAPFKDGKLSAGMHAKRVKNNQEVDQASDMGQQLSRIVIGNLYNNADFRSAALPHRVAQPFFARYGKGMTYGDHIDDPVMGQDPQRFRCDLACTVFLNNADEYEGGELTVRTPFGDQIVKLDAGDAVLYPASSLHSVAEVNKGERLVAVTWIQSMVRDAGKRELLHELNQARETLMKDQPDAPTTAQVDHSYANLVRMWAEI